MCIRDSSCQPPAKVGDGSQAQTLPARTLPLLWHQRRPRQEGAVEGLELALEEVSQAELGPVPRAVCLLVAGPRLVSQPSQRQQVLQRWAIGS
eukprot:13845242-Alexandrium_andersonii.AAC.1